MENPAPSTKKWTKKKVAFVVGSFIFLILVIALVSGGGDNTDQATQQEAKQTTASVKTGDEGYLNNGLPEVLVATSKANFEKLIKLSVANDNLGLAKMTIDGEAYFVDSNTKILVISSSVGSREIRILEGSQFSNSGWVPAEFIFKDKK